MEQRSSTRTPASIDLLIYQCGFPVAIGVTRDISNAGIFMQTGYVRSDRDSALEFELLYNRKGPGARRRYRALITEQRSDGLVLTFDESSARDARKLAEMVEWVASANGKIAPVNADRKAAVNEKIRYRATPSRIVKIPNVPLPVFDRAQS